MQWIQGFESYGGHLRLTVVDDRGAHTHCELRDLRSVAPARMGARVAKLDGIRLTQLVEHGPGEFLKLWGFDVPVTSTHTVYELQTSTARLLVPASVLMLGLFSRMWAVSPWLTSASSLDRLAVPSIDGGIPSVTFFPGAFTGTRERAVTQQRFLWLTCFLSARRMWASVHSYAKTRTLALDLPLARIYGSASGLSRGRTILVTRLHINEVEPLEEPMMLKEHLAGRRFLVSPRGSFAVRPPVLADSTIPQGTAGWRMSDAEWRDTSKLLDVRSLLTARVRLDEILFKLGTGQAWDSISLKADARNYYFRLKRQGRWEKIRAAILTHRIAEAASPA